MENQDLDEDMRLAAFLWIRERSDANGGIFSRDELQKGFPFHGGSVTLMGPSGIWIPRGFTIPVSITTTSTGPYDDGLTDEGFLTYKYRGSDPDIRDNVGLRLAYEQRRPLIYFKSIMRGKYEAIYPVFIRNDDPVHLQVTAALDPAYGSLMNDADFSDAPEKESVLGIRRYIITETKHRLHQAAFREYVLDAYSRQCAICRLQHPELLDAAHIIPDSEEDGAPVVKNGISLCKIHHAAFDNNIIGINPDYVIKVREDVLREQDGPMLQFGIQSLEGSHIILPKNKEDYPDQERLEKRFAEFIA